MIFAPGQPLLKPKKQEKTTIDLARVMLIGRLISKPHKVNSRKESEKNYILFDLEIPSKTPSSEQIYTVAIMDEKLKEDAKRLQLGQRVYVEGSLRQWELREDNLQKACFVLLTSEESRLVALGRPKPEELMKELLNIHEEKKIEVEPLKYISDKTIIEKVDDTIQKILDGKHEDITIAGEMNNPRKERDEMIDDDDDFGEEIDDDDLAEEIDDDDLGEEIDDDDLGEEIDDDDLGEEIDDDNLGEEMDDVLEDDKKKIDVNNKEKD